MDTPVDQSHALRRYADALQAHGHSKRVFEADILSISFLVAALQRALRHPNCSRHLRPHITAFIDGALGRVSRHAEVIAEVWRLGNDPHHESVMQEEGEADGQGV